MPTVPQEWRGTVLGSGGASDLIQLVDGNIVVAWTDKGALTARILDPVGTPVGNAFALVQSANNGNPQMASLPNGGFVLAYEHQTSGIMNIRLEERGADGSLIGAMVPVATDDKSAAPNYADVTIAASGNSSVLVAYEYEFSATDRDIRFKIYNPVSDALGTETGLFTSDNSEFDPDVAALSNGNYVAVATQDVDGDEAVVFKILGPGASDQMTISGTAANGLDDHRASVAALPNGGFVIVFASDLASGGQSVSYRVFNASGGQIKAGTLDIAAELGNTIVDVASLPDSSFVVTTSASGLVAAGRSFAHVTPSDEYVSKFLEWSLNPEMIGLRDGRFVTTTNPSGDFFSELTARLLDTRDTANSPVVYGPDRWQVGTTADDTIAATGEVLHGWKGDDVITDQLLVNRIYGDDGDDLVVVTTAIGGDQFDGGDGVDTMDWRQSSAAGATFDLSLGFAAVAGSFELIQNFENFIGTDQDDTIVGTFGANVLNGAGGTDTLSGLSGNDHYRVDESGDVIKEVKGDGVADRVSAAADFALGAGVDVEILTTTSAAGTSAIDLTGNSLSQEITGNAGNNVLHDGGAGASDALRGLAGDDTYRVYNVADVVVETASQGTADFVNAAVSYALGASVHIETLRTNSGSAATAINLYGNEIAQAITGNNGDNRLDGKGGADTLRGLGGADTFVFGSKLGGGNIDTILDFNPTADRFLLSDAIFTKLTPGTITDAQFRANSTGEARDASDRIVYDKDSGGIFYDPDGLGGAAGVRFATVGLNLAITFDDFDVV